MKLNFERHNVALGRHGSNVKYAGYRKLLLSSYRQDWLAMFDRILELEAELAALKEKESAPEPKPSAFIERLRALKSDAVRQDDYQAMVAIRNVIDTLKEQHAKELQAHKEKRDGEETDQEERTKTDRVAGD